MNEIELDDQLRSLLSAPQIARQTGHSAMCIYRALKRLGIRPVVTIPSKRYAGDVPELLRQKMRAPRRVSKAA